MSAPVLIVFSHVRWNFVYRRPQHLMSRLAPRWRVIFVEEPVFCEGAAHLQVRAIDASLTVLVPHTSLPSPGFDDNQIARLEPLLELFLYQHALQPDIAWFYTPMALPLAKTVDARCVVYDCIDELSALKGVPGELQRRETSLMEQAALVLTGGPSLYGARRDQHVNVHCFPSAVDVEHFAPGGLHLTTPHYLKAQSLQGELPYPRLGYFGVIDERVDLDLVVLLADAHPEWSIVMAGPVVKIAPGSLPQRPNLHWLGMQPYERLPYLLADWDMCLMPFARNESTRFISPTKTLEYMAGEKPVVSTAVPDVILLYGSVVAVAQSPMHFVRVCEDMLREAPDARARRAIDMLQVVSMNSWSRSADKVHSLLQSALRRVQDSPATLVSQYVPPAPPRAVRGSIRAQARPRAGDARRALQ